jgi:hypothetical protein
MSIEFKNNKIYNIPFCGIGTFHVKEEFDIETKKYIAEYMYLKYGKEWHFCCGEKGIMIDTKEYNDRLKIKE